MRKVRPTQLLLLLALLALAVWLILAKPTTPIVLPPPEEATDEDIQNAWQHWSAAHHRNDHEEAKRILEWLDEVAYLRLQEQETPK